MISKIRLAVLVGLVSTTALSGYASTNPYSMPQTHDTGNKMQVHQGVMELKSDHPKHKQTLNMQAVKEPKGFKAFVAKKILITFDRELEDLDLIGKNYEGQMITDDIFAAINKEIVDYYLAHDYLLPQVNLDKDAMLTGLLILDVKAAKINNVIITGDDENNKVLAEYADKIKQQDPAMKRYTQKYLGLMNKVPGIEVAYELMPSQDVPGAIDLVVFSNAKKASVFAGVDNFGPNDLGKYQFSLLGEAFRPFNSGDALSMHGSTTNHPNRLNDIGAGYSQILNSYGTTGHLFAAYSQDNSSVQSAQPTPNGVSSSFRAALTQQLLLRPNHDLEFEIGSQYRTSTTYQLNNDTNLVQKYQVSKYTTADAGFRYLFSDPYGRNLVNTNYARGMGGYFQNYIDNPPMLPKKHFNKFSFSYFRDQQLINKFSAFFHVAASHSKDNLPSAEQAIFGGRDFGRGYDFATLSGTKMQAGAVELRYTQEMNNLMTELQPYLYADTGHVNKYAAGTNVSNLSSLGGGLRVKFMKAVDLGVEYAHPTKRHFMVSNSNITAKDRVNIFINKVFEF